LQCRHRWDPSSSPCFSLWFVCDCLFCVCVCVWLSPKPDRKRNLLVTSVPSQKSWKDFALMIGSCRDLSQKYAQLSKRRVGLSQGSSWVVTDAHHVKTLIQEFFLFATRYVNDKNECDWFELARRCSEQAWTVARTNVRRFSDFFPSNWGN
jgi:hypothetical protein